MEARPREPSFFQEGKGAESCGMGRGSSIPARPGGAAGARPRIFIIEEFHGNVGAEPGASGRRSSASWARCGGGGALIPGRAAAGPGPPPPGQVSGAGVGTEGGGRGKAVPPQVDPAPGEGPAAFCS